MKSFMRSLPPGIDLTVSNGEWIEAGTLLAKPITTSSGESHQPDQSLSIKDQELVARVSGRVILEDSGHLYIQYEGREEREYLVPPGSHIRIKSGDEVKAGTQLTDGAIDPQDILRIMGREAVQQYLVEEVQKVYGSQGVNISDKHIEIIARQMLRRVRVESPGDTDLLSGDLIDRFDYESINAKALAEGGEPATAQTVLLGITRSSLNTSSWLSAASFQETTRVLTEAAIWGKTDKLLGLKENVIIGKLIPAQALNFEEEIEEQALALDEAMSSELTEYQASDETAILNDIETQALELSEEMISEEIKAAKLDESVVSEETEVKNSELDDGTSSDEDSPSLN